MVTVGEFREATEALIDYILEHEYDDFVRQLEDDEEGCPGNHIYFAAFVAWCGLQELDGEGYETLWSVVHHDYDGQYFYCENNQKCGYIGTKVEPIQDRLVLALPSGEPMPSGVCPRCAGLVVAV